MIFAAGKGRVVVVAAKCASTSILRGFESIGRSQFDRRDKLKYHLSRAKEINLVVRGPAERLFSAYQMFFVNPARAIAQGKPIDQRFSAHRGVIEKNIHRYIQDPVWGFRDFYLNHFEKLYLTDPHFAPQWHLYGYPVVMHSDRVRLWRMDQLEGLGKHVGILIPHENSQVWLWEHTDLYSVIQEVYDQSRTVNGATVYREDHWLWSRAKQ